MAFSVTSNWSCRSSAATSVQLSEKAQFFKRVCVCVFAARCARCCDQSQFNRHGLKVNLQGAMKADRWGLTAVSRTHIKAAATVAASEEDKHFWKEQRDSESAEHAGLVKRRGMAESVNTKRAWILKRPPSGTFIFCWTWIERITNLMGWGSNENSCLRQSSFSVGFVQFHFKILFTKTCCWVWDFSPSEY